LFTKISNKNLLLDDKRDFKIILELRKDGQKLSTQGRSWANGKDALVRSKRKKKDVLETYDTLMDDCQT